MSQHDKAERRKVSDQGQYKRVGTSVLVAAASLLGTSLGVSAADSNGPRDLLSQNDSGSRPVEHTTVLAATLTPKVNVQPPHVVVKTINPSNYNPKETVPSSNQMKVIDRPSANYSK
jgi:hypothetical protein